MQVKMTISDWTYLQLGANDAEMPLRLYVTGLLTGRVKASVTRNRVKLGEAFVMEYNCFLPGLTQAHLEAAAERSGLALADYARAVFRGIVKPPRY